MSRKSEMKELLEYIRKMKGKYPEEDVIGKINKEFAGQSISAIGASRINAFKEQVIASFGTDNEMTFNDIEEGFVQAIRMEGQSAIKEVLEQMPVDTPACADGVKMRNKGREKKTS